MRINEYVWLIPSWAGWVPRYWELCVFHYWNAFTFTDGQNLDLIVFLSKLKKKHAEAEYSTSTMRLKSNNPGQRAHFGWHFSEGISTGAAKSDLQWKAFVSLQSILPENTTYGTEPYLSLSSNTRSTYRIFLVNKYLNLHIFQYFTVLATYIKSCTASCRMLPALPGVHFNSSHTIFHCRNGK